MANVATDEYDCDGHPACLGHTDRHGHHDAGQLDRGLRHQGYDVVGGRPSCRQRHGHAHRPVDLDLGCQHVRPAGPPERRRRWSNRVAAAWDSATSFSVAVNLTDGQPHNLSLYAVDWNNAGRSEQIQFTDAATGAILDTETISAFSGGVYLEWSVTGDVVIQVTNLAGPNAVLSGLFLDAPATAVLVGSDPSTEGSWVGEYGAQGYNLAGIGTSIPSYETVTFTGQSTLTWASSSTDARDLENAGGVAAAWSSATSFTVNVNVTDGQAHDLSVYAVDWDTARRSEQIQLSSAVTGAILDTETISSFNGGVYLEWRITGDVVIEVTDLAGPSAVLSGLFLDPTSRPAAAASLSILAPTITTAGNSFSITVTAKSASDSTLLNYTGPVHFTSTDPGAILPPDYTFTLADDGTHTFRITLTTSGTSGITVTDTTNAALTVSVADIVVKPAVATTLALTGYPSTTTSGAAQSFELTAYDPYGNTVSTYTGTVHFTSSDLAAALPADYTFVASDAGSHTFTATLNTDGTQMITVTDAADGLSAAISGIMVVPTAPITNATIWSNTTVPANPSQNDPSSIEVGVKFDSSVAGYITGVRFYKGSGNAGTHVGHLWTSTGTLLATANFTNETASGWQQVNFTTPVAITAGTTYVASYFAPAGHYADDPNYFASGVTNGVLTALASGAAGGNGVYVDAASGGFPTNTSQSDNYWVDVVFSTAPPIVIATTPGNPAGGVSLEPGIAATFNEAVVRNSISFGLVDSSGNPVAATLAYSAATNTATLVPNAPLALATTYTATISGAKDQAGDVMSSPVSWSFTTVASIINGSIWSSSSVPQNPSWYEINAAEVGVKFESSVAGYITGIRFYKGTGNGGTHVGHLWTSTGTLLASATFTDESEIGWQQVNFSSAVAITAGTVYVASYFAPEGWMAYDQNYFTFSGATNGSLTALSKAASGGNGVYLYSPTGGFPNTSQFSSNYWVDVVFSTVDTITPAVTGESPPAGATNVPKETSLTATFSEAVQQSTISFTLTDPNDNIVPATLSYNSTTNVATLMPTSLLSPLTTYTATIDGAEDDAGNVMASAFTWSFTTSSFSTVPPTITSMTPTGGATLIATINTDISATFSEPVQSGTITFTLQGLEWQHRALFRHIQRLD